MAECPERELRRGHVCPLRLKVSKNVFVGDADFLEARIQVSILGLTQGDRMTHQDLIMDMAETLSLA